MEKEEWKMINVKPQTVKKLETLGLYFVEDRAVLLDTLVSALLNALGDALDIEAQSGASAKELINQKYTIGIAKEGIAQKVYAIKMPLVGSAFVDFRKSEKQLDREMAKRVKKHFASFEGRETKKQTVAKLKIKVRKK
jgi:adenosyl cobinamide kinase/adenosyl cobinamide phosphate guanylyltransferase